METRWLSSKEKVLGTAVRKDDSDGLLGPIIIDFLEKGATMDCFFC